MNLNSSEVPPSFPMVANSRPSEKMAQALKRHILNERQKKRQEQEADAEVERQRREQELKQKQNDMTLGENLEQIARLEELLTRLKEEKHQLFLQLKKVLNDDDLRRRQLIRQMDSCDVNDVYGGLYSNVNPIESHPLQAVITQTYPIPERSNIYKVPAGHTLLPQGTLKRARSPSPPLQSAYSAPFGHKSPAPRVNYASNKRWQVATEEKKSYLQPICSGQSAYSYTSSQYSQSGGGRNEGSGTPPQSKLPLYLPQPLPPRPQLNPAYIHSSVEHVKGGYPDDKFYSSVPPIRPTSHVPLHGGGIPIQQPAQGVKTGGITSGYPIRPTTSSGPSHRGAPNAPSPHAVYVSQPNNVQVARHPSHNQPGPGSEIYMQRIIDL